ncbi:MAG: hypothetical protein ACFB11_23555 [Paracoccaceae bacterium]
MDTSPKKQHIGKLFEFKLDSCSVFALCVCHEKKFGYLLKWFPKGTLLVSLDPISASPFCYKFVPLDQAMRHGAANVVEKIPNFESYRPLMRAGGGVKPDGSGTLPWYIDDGQNLERVDPDDDRLPYLSDVGLAGLGFMDDLYRNDQTPERQFRRLSAT